MPYSPDDLADLISDMTGKLDAVLAGGLLYGGGGGLTSADAVGFVKGLGATEAALNRTAWIDLMASGGSVFFGPGDWDLRFTAITQTVNGDVTLRGAGSMSRLWVNASSTYLDIGDGNVDIAWLHFYAPSQLGNSTLIGLDSQTADIDHLLVQCCWFTNLYVPIRSTSTSALASVNPFVIDQLRINNNTVRGIGGLSRIATKRGGRVIEYVGNYIDCGAAGGIPAGYAGIYHGLVANSGLVLSPEEVGERPRFEGNTVRNVKPLADPRSAGNYGIITNCPGALITGNKIDKCYPFYGSFSATCAVTNGSNVLTGVTNISRVVVGQGVAEGVGAALAGIPVGATVTAVDSGAGTVTISANVTRATGSGVQITFTDVVEEETIFTGNGSTTTFIGSLTRRPTPDSLAIRTGGSTIASDLDHGWAKGGASRQKIVSSAGVELGWIDYNSGAWSLTFPTAPANGAVYTARYFEGLAVDNVEAIYDKSHGATISDNSCYDCSGRQGVIGLKAGGQTAGVGPRQAAGGYGETVTGNVISNRVQTGVFRSSRGVWLQSDVVLIDGNLFEGLCDRIVRFRPNSTGGRQMIFGPGNRIRDYYGGDVITLLATSENTRISLDIDGLYYSGSQGFINLVQLEATGGTEHRNLIVERVLVSDRVTAGKPVVVANVESDSASFVDLGIERVKIRAPWRGVLKTGNGSAGRIRIGPYTRDNLISTGPLIAGATVSNDLVFERSGTAITDSTAWSDEVGAANQIIPYVIDTGGANTIIVVVTSVSLTALSPGLILNVQVSATNSGAVTLDVNGLGARPVVAEGAALTAGSLTSGRVYTMVYDGTSWQVQGLPQIVEQVLAATGYEVTRRGMIRCWGKIDMGANSTVDWTLPKKMPGWINVTAMPFWSGAGADYGLDFSVIGKTINRDSNGHVESITFVNNSNNFVQLHIDARGT